MLNRNFKPAFVVVFVLLVVLVFFILYNSWKNDLKENINFEKESFKEEEPNFNKETISEDIEEIFKTAFKFFNYK